MEDEEIRRAKTEARRRGKSVSRMIAHYFDSLGKRPNLAKGLSINNLRNLAPRFGPDLDGTIEGKPRHSLDYVEAFSIEARSKMARRWDARWEGYLLTGPNNTNKAGT